MAEAARVRTSHAEYLALEEADGLKHELVDGEVIAMTGGTFAHGLLISNLLAALRAALHGRPCLVLASENRLRLPVICGGVRFDVEDPQAVTNPVLLAEVLSPGSEAADRGERFREYRSIETLQHYLLISQARVLVELFSRGVDGRWTLQEYGAEGLVALPALQIELPVRALYEGLELPA